VEVVLASRKQEVLEILGDGRHQVVLHRSILSDEVSAAIRRSVTATLQLTVTPESQWWHEHSGEFRFRSVERSVLLNEYRWFGNWQRIAIALACILAGLEATLALATAISEIKLAVTGGALTAFGGAFTLVLRYLAKEKAATMARLAHANENAAKLLSLAQPMAVISKFTDQPTDKLKSVVDMYKKKEIP
jgi:hypothetical protein